VSPKPAYSEFQASLGYIVRPCLKNCNEIYITVLAMKVSRTGRYPCAKRKKNLLNLDSVTQRTKNWPQTYCGGKAGEKQKGT